MYDIYDMYMYLSHCDKLQPSRTPSERLMYAQLTSCVYWEGCNVRLTIS